MHPLCYEVIPYHLGRDRIISFGEKMTNLRLFPRTDDFYIDFLFRYSTKKEPVYYSKLSSQDKNCADVFFQIHLVDISHDFVIFLHGNINIWEKYYNKSFNWYEYYQQDSKDDKFNRLKGVLHE